MFEPSALKGIIPPILTPLDDEERVDRQSLEHLVNYMIEGGVHGIWATGTTGEFPCIDERQRAIAVETTVSAVAGRMPVVASVGDSSTMLAVRHGLNAKAAGADFIAATPPHYYVNSADEMLTHYRTLREKVDCPLLVYNIPQNVKVQLTVKTVLTLAEEGTVVGIKDSQNNLDWFRQVMVGAREQGKGFRGFLGTRYLVDAGLIAGAHGSIPSIANIAPRIASDIYERAIVGDWAGAAVAQEKLGKLALKIDGVQPMLSALKYSMKILGVIENPRMTLPFRTFGPADEGKLAAILREAGLLE